MTGARQVVGTRTASPTVDSLPALLGRMHAALSSRQQVLDDLNVFPVPDGDTGTNMVATLRAAIDEVTVENGRRTPGWQEVGASGGSGAASRPASSVSAVFAAIPPGGSSDALARAVVRGAIHGARGNSGVILSQVLRAIVEAIVAPEPFDAQRYAAALDRARDLAYDAVATPVEGTILTVIGAAADAAERAAADGGDLAATSAAVCDAAGAAVARTRDQLDALREAGVVDAGARGFELILAAIHGHLTGDDPPVVLDPPRPGGLRDDPHTEHAGADHQLPVEVPEQVVEVQYLLDAPDTVASMLRHTLHDLGESVVVVGGGGLLNVHVHTTRIGAVIEAGTAFGPVTRIRVEPLVSARDRPASPPLSVADPRPVGVVAVVDGAGLATLVESYGAVAVDVAADLPVSTADLLVGIGRANAEQVLLLPGRSDALGAAHEAAESAALGRDRGVVVIERAASPPAVLAALAVFDPDGDPAETVTSMERAGGGVRAGRVQCPARDLDQPTGDVSAEQVAAIVDDEVVARHDDPLDALAALARTLRAPDAELVTLLVGDAVDAQQRRAAPRIIDPRGHDDPRLVDGGASGPDLALIDSLQRDVLFWLGVE